MNRRLIIMRHGQTDWNVEKRMQGHTDIPLNAHGVMQADRLAKALLKTGQHFDCIYSSDLERAFHTAKTIAVPQSLDVLIHPDLRERIRDMLRRSTNPRMVRRPT